jgi:hypothetical protein
LEDGMGMTCIKGECQWTREYKMTVNHLKVELNQQPREKRNSISTVRTENS